ncbi:MAG TPA: TolC family protein [Candidatus Rifleibacterium sp.]|jgi:outer membrane protein TolC|nr:TolC family protein [Candidatus Rifleibacterium sp.]
MIHRKLIPTLILFCLHLTAGWSANLAELAQTALSRNLSLHISDLEIEQSFIEEKRALNALIPDVNFNINKTHKDFKDDYQKKSPASIDNMLSYSLKLTQSYPGLGRIPVIQREIAALKSDMKKTYKENQKIRVLRDLTRIYFKMVRDQELMKIHETDLILIAELMKVAKLNEELGLVLRNDILRIEVEQLNSNSELVKARNSFGDLKYDLAAVLDIQNPEEIKLDLAKGLRFAPASHTTESLLPDLFKIDNDINLARTDLQILNKTVRSARSANLPTLTIDASYNHGRKVGPIEGTRDFATTFILSTPVYNGNDIENAVRLAQKSEEIVKLRIQDLSNTKKALLEKAVADYNEALARISFAEKMVEQSIENMRIVFTRYQEGASSIVELIDAQRLLTNSSQTAIKAFYDERERLAEILLLLHRFDELFNLDQNASILNTDFLMQTLKIGENK